LWDCCVGVYGTFRTIPNVESYGAGVFCSRPNPYSCIPVKSSGGNKKLLRCTAGFTIFPSFVALVTKKMHVECTKYVRRHTPATASSRQPQTTYKRTMAVASGFDTTISNSFLGQISYFERGKSIASICSGHPLNFFCIGGMGL
jgi:hypothetical protein